MSNTICIKDIKEATKFNNYEEFKNEIYRLLPVPHNKETDEIVVFQTPLPEQSKTDEEMEKDKNKENNSKEKKDDKKLNMTNGAYRFYVHPLDICRRMSTEYVFEICSLDLKKLYKTDVIAVSRERCITTSDKKFSFEQASDDTYCNCDFEDNIGIVYGFVDKHITLTKNQTGLLKYELTLKGSPSWYPVIQSILCFLGFNMQVTGRDSAFCGRERYDLFDIISSYIKDPTAKDLNWNRKYGYDLNTNYNKRMNNIYASVDNNKELFQNWCNEVERLREMKKH
ncbi:MAG: hypothetical protein K5989_11395 [Lachnospiraceae bacterium]|nr:hypothetical protein [Lachnospiraceae bacterium]